jgi:divalent anion:Na+ symporter, DASS family
LRRYSLSQHSADKHIEKAKVQYVPLIISFSVAVILWFFPTPQGLKPEAWHMFAIFITTILGIILKALPMSGMALIGLVALVFSHTVTLKEALSGFSDPIIWLVLMAFFISKSFVKTGLGIRIAYRFIAFFGKKTLGLAYGMGLADLVLAPAIPSVTARAGGIIFPIIKSLAVTYDSHPNEASHRKIGAYLIQCAFHINIITGAMFLTAMAANPLIADIASGLGISISWGKWALAAVVPGLLSFLFIPYLLYKIYPPEIKETPGAEKMAKEHLKEMGKMKNEEWVTLFVFAMMLILWILGETIGVNSTSTALLGVGILLVTGVLKIKDIIHEGSAWDTFLWFSILIMMASSLNTLGVIKWVTSGIEVSVAAISWHYAFAILFLVYFYSHYLFASITAHVSSMFAAFVTVGIAAGAPPALMVLAMIFGSNLSASLTHYGNGPAPILFGAGYVDLVRWWKLGFIVSVSNILIWIGVGSAWWKFLGFW